MTRRLVALCVVALFCTSLPAPAAAQAVRATVLGTVTDRTGAVLPGATITITNIDTKVAQATVSDSQGHYTLSNLLPAPYDIEASLPGFQTVVRNSVRLVIQPDIQLFRRCGQAGACRLEVTLLQYPIAQKPGLTRRAAQHREHLGLCRRTEQ